MRNYLVFEGDSLLAFQYPEDRELEVGTEFIVDVAMDKKDTISKTVTVKITQIIKQENKNRILYHVDVV